MFDDCSDATPKTVDIFSLYSDYLQTMACERLRNVITFKVFTGMAGNSDVIVVNDQLYVEVLSNSESGSFSVVTFLLGSI